MREVERMPRRVPLDGRVRPVAEARMTMTDDDLKKIVDEAADESGYGGLDSSTMYGEFALEVAKKVRERCAVVCDQTGAYTDEIEMAHMCAAAIRGA